MRNLDPYARQFLIHNLLSGQLTVIDKYVKLPKKKEQTLINHRFDQSLKRNPKAVYVDLAKERILKILKEKQQEKVEMKQKATAIEQSLGNSN